MITANHPHVTNLPLQVRCSSQPTGFRSSLRRIQRRKKESHTIGWQKVRWNHTCSLEGGLSCQELRVFAPAATIDRTRIKKENSVASLITRNNWPVVATRV